MRRTALLLAALSLACLSCLTYRGVVIRVPGESRQKGVEQRERILAALDETGARYGLERIDLDTSLAGRDDRIVASWNGPSEGAHPSRGIQVTLRGGEQAGWVIGVSDFHTPGGSQRYYDIAEALSTALEPLGAEVERTGLGVWPP